MTPTSTETLSDREQIVELAVRYATALDSRDWDLLRTCFTADAVAAYEGFDEVRGYEAIEAVCRGALEPLDVSQHIVTNFAVTIDGDEAEHTCYLQAQHVKSSVEGSPLFIIAGRYVDRLRRTDDGWRIARRELVGMWTDGNPAVVAHAQNA